MVKRIQLVLASCCGVFFTGNSFAMDSSQAIESAIANYDGVLGTAPKAVTVSAAGVAVQEMQNATQAYAFFTQTLANQIYYEARVWGAYNYMSQNPIFTSVQPSNMQNPPGYGVSGFIGYNFHTTDLLDITPYYRMNYFKDMAVVYEDTNGNYLHSVALAGFLGVKLTFKESKYFNPYVNFWAGFQQVSISGNLQPNPTASQVQQNATVDQIVANTQIGLNMKVSKEISLIPYWQYQTVASYPDSVALAPVNKGGFAIQPFTATQQIIGMKLSVAW